MPHLFFIAAETEDGDSLDQLVSADTPEQAHEFWQKTWCDDPDNPEFVGPVETGFTQEEIFAEPDHNFFARIFLVQPSGNVGLIGWHSIEPGGSMILLGFVRP